MSEYIDREAFIAEQRHLYCDNCERRKGKMKNGKMRFAYEIGDAPCRACRYGDVLDDLEDYRAADMRPVVKAEWLPFGRRGIYGVMYECSACHAKYDGRTNFCPNCGADMREES